MRVERTVISLWERGLANPYDRNKREAADLRGWTGSLDELFAVTEDEIKEEEERIPIRIPSTIETFLASSLEPSMQKHRLDWGSKLREGVKKTKESPHETSQDVRKSNQAFLPARDIQVSKLSKVSEESIDGIGENSGDIKWCDQDDPWRVPLFES